MDAQDGQDGKAPLGASPLLLSLLWFLWLIPPNPSIFSSSLLLHVLE